jgi:hypothetical protein
MLSAVTQSPSWQLPAGPDTRHCVPRTGRAHTQLAAIVAGGSGDSHHHAMVVSIQAIASMPSDPRLTPVIVAGGSVDHG